MKLEMLLYTRRIGSLLLIVFVCYSDTAAVSSNSILLNATATQSGTYNNYEAMNAIDRDTDTHSIAVSSPPAWWRVDLKVNFTFTGVILTGRTDSIDYKYLANFTIWVGSSDSVNGSGQLCYHYNLPDFIPIAQYPFHINCSQPLTGQYLAIRREGGYRMDALTLAEVDVQGYLFATSTTTTTTTTTAPTEPSTHPQITSTQSTSQANVGPSTYRTITVPDISPTSSCPCCTGSKAASASDQSNNSSSINDTTLIIIIVVLGCVLFISLCIHVVIIIVYNVKIRQLMKKINYLSNFETSQGSELYDNDIQYEPAVEYAVYSTIRTYGQRSTRRRHPGLNAMSQFNARRRSQPRFPDYYSASTFRRPQFNDNRKSDDFTRDYLRPN